MGVAPAEVVTRVSPLGIRLWDTVTQQTISDELRLGVQTASGPAAARIAVNPSGVFVIENLPGLAEEELTIDSQALWPSPPLVLDYVVTVDDALGRFLPFSWRLAAPTVGIVQLPCPAGTWIPGPIAGPAIPLFSAPTRPVPAGTAAIRAQLWDATADQPAAGALVQVDSGASPAVRGLADALGQALVLMPYPPLPSGLGSPPVGQALADQVWTVSVSVFYDPAAAASGPVSHPDLCALLSQPPVAAVLTTSPPAPAITATLGYGQELTLRTPGGSTLLIEP